MAFSCDSLLDGLVGCYRNQFFSGLRGHGDNARYGPDAMRLISTASAWRGGASIRAYDYEARAPLALPPAVDDWYGHTAPMPLHRAARAPARRDVRHLGNGFSGAQDPSLA